MVCTLASFRLVPCKRTVYDTDLRVPFYMSGPGIAAGTVLDHVTHLAPTLLALASVTIPERMGGRSFAYLVVPTVTEAPAGYRPRGA